jgi:putative salt-induced outer membrane protein YdiY
VSYDKGEANGVWASLGADTLEGKNVEDNWRVRWNSEPPSTAPEHTDRRTTISLGYKM